MKRVRRFCEDYFAKHLWEIESESGFKHALSDAFEFDINVDWYRDKPNRLIVELMFLNEYERYVSLRCTTESTPVNNENNF